MKRYRGRGDLLINYKGVRNVKKNRSLLFKIVKYIATVSLLTLAILAMAIIMTICFSSGYKLMTDFNVTSLILFILSISIVYFVVKRI